MLRRGGFGSGTVSVSDCPRVDWNRLCVECLRETRKVSDIYDPSSTENPKYIVNKNKFQPPDDIVKPWSRRDRKFLECQTTSLPVRVGSHRVLSPFTPHESVPSCWTPPPRPPRTLPETPPPPLSVHSGFPPHPQSLLLSLPPRSHSLVVHVSTLCSLTSKDEMGSTDSHRSCVRVLLHPFRRRTCTCRTLNYPRRFYNYVYRKVRY